MGCPYDAKFIFGIKITKEKYKELDKRMDEDESLTDDDYFEMSYDQEQDDNYYIEVGSTNISVNNCSFIEAVSMSRLESAKAKSEIVFDKSNLLQESFDKSDITGLLICDYTG